MLVTVLTIEQEEDKEHALGAECTATKEGFVSHQKVILKTLLK